MKSVTTQQTVLINGAPYVIVAGTAYPVAQTIKPVSQPVNMFAGYAPAVVKAPAKKAKAKSKVVETPEETAYVNSEIARKNELITNPSKKYVSGKKVSPSYYALKTAGSNGKNGHFVTMKVSSTGKLTAEGVPFKTKTGRKLHRK